MIKVKSKNSNRNRNETCYLKLTSRQTEASMGGLMYYYLAKITQTRKKHCKQLFQFPH